MNDFLKKAVINYLFYRKDMDIKEATDTFYDNIDNFNKMYEIFGDDFINGVLKYINKEKN